MTEGRPQGRDSPQFRYLIPKGDEDEDDPVPSTLRSESRRN